jgi:hypothetical protein
MRLEGAFIEQARVGGWEYYSDFGWDIQSARITMRLPDCIIITGHHITWLNRPSKGHPTTIIGRHFLEVASPPPASRKRS